MVDPYGIDEEADCHLVVASRTPSRVDRIDPSDGSQQELAGGGALRFVSGIAVVRYRCDDGFDNDGDGRVDLADEGCVDARDPSEGPHCGLGYEQSLLLPLLMGVRSWVRRQRRCA
jgi:hypothetical protein